MELKSREAESLQQQRDQYVGHLQQYLVAYQQHVAAYQQLALDKEMLHKQVLLQTKLMDRLQHEDVQVKAEAEKARQELEETQVRGFACRAPRGGPAAWVPSHSLLAPQGRLEAATQQNQQLQAQLSLMAVPGEGKWECPGEEDRAQEEGDFEQHGAECGGTFRTATPPAWGTGCWPEVARGRAGPGPSSLSLARSTSPVGSSEDPPRLPRQETSWTVRRRTRRLPGQSRACRRAWRAQRPW